MRREIAVLAMFLAAGCATVAEPVIGPAWSAPDAARPLGHADCVRLAAESAPTAAAWRARLASAQAALRQAGTPANPSMSLGWENLGLAATPIQTTLTLAYSLESLAARPREKTAAQFDLDATRADLLAERARLAADVCRSYDELVAARRRLALAADATSVAERSRAAVERFAAAGAKASLDVDRAEAESMQARANQASALFDARAKEWALAFALGFDRPVALQLSEGLTSGPAQDDLSALEAAATSRPEIAAASARYRAALERAHLAADRFQLLPSVTGGPRKEGSDTSRVLSLDVDIPVFDTGGAAIDAASAELLAAAAELRRTSHEVSGEVVAAAERLAETDAYVTEFARPLAARRVALRETAERLFAEGEIEFDEVTVARRDEVEARGALLDAELAAAQARTDLDAATGRIAADAVH